MCAHNSPARRDSMIEHVLHYRALVSVFGKAHAIALPVGTRPLRFRGRNESGNVSQQSPVASGHLPSVRDGLGNPLQLLASNGGLDVREAIIEAQFRKWNLRSIAGSAVVNMPPSPVVSSLRG